MPRCPVCDAPRVTIVLGETRRGMCTACGARWIQDGELQRQVEPSPPVNQRTGAR
jgi:hypothetical protein